MVTPKFLVENIESLYKIWIFFKKQKKSVQISFVLLPCLICLSLLWFGSSELRWAKLISKFSKNIIINGDFESPLDSSIGGWGTGNYEKMFEDINKNKLRSPIFWISSKAEADIKGYIDYRILVNGNRSFKIINNHSQENNVFGTISQRVSVKPHAKYLFSSSVRFSEDTLAGILNIVFYPDEWNDRIKPSLNKKGRWIKVEKIINSDEYQDLHIRFISENLGTVWIDDVSLKPINLAALYCRFLPFIIIVALFLWLVNITETQSLVLSKDGSTHTIDSEHSKSSSLNNEEKVMRTSWFGFGHLNSFVMPGKHCPFCKRDITIEIENDLPGFSSIKINDSAVHNHLLIDDGNIMYKCPYCEKKFNIRNIR